MAFPLLFSPIEIGSMSLRNRLVMSPMENQFGTPDGRPTERTIDYFAARARGGVGLITLGASAIDEKHKEVPSSIHFASDDIVADHKALTDAVHAHGACIQPQIAHAGPDGLGPEMHGVEAIGPSAIQSFLTGTTSRAVSSEDWAAVLTQYSGAARRAREAGYDGIELHAAHGYMLLGSFLTPWRNARRDDYSARKREGRIKALVETIRAIKDEAGHDFPITLRISGYERIAGGRESFDTARIAPELVDAGIDAFHVSGGVIDRFVTQMVNGSHYPDALNRAGAEAVKRAVDVPVIAVGRIHDPALAEQLLQEGRADMIAMARPLLADPELPNKAREGQRDRIRHCISCENCIDAMETRFALECAVNPRTGRERALAISPAPGRQHVVVVGGGPGGLEAARVAALRGHRVSLYDENPRLGGALILASTVHAENQPFLDYLLGAVSRLPIDVHLGQRLSTEALVALGPDATIIATGGRMQTPRIPGDDGPHVLTGSLLRGFLSGPPDSQAARRLPIWQRAGLSLLGPSLKRLATPARIRAATRAWMPIGRRVAVVGADLAGLELAEFLAERGRHVALLEPEEEIAPEVGAKRRDEHMLRLDRAGVAINTGVRIERITRDGVMLQLAPGHERLVPAETVILAGQLAPDTRLYDSVRERLPSVHAVGDCTGLGLIRKAALEGAEAACAVGADPN